MYSHGNKYILSFVAGVHGVAVESFVETLDLVKKCLVSAAKSEDNENEKYRFYLELEQLLSQHAAE